MPNGLSKDLPCGPFRQFVPWGAWCSWQLQQRFLVYVNIFVFQMVVRTVQISYGLHLPYLTLYKTWITLGPCSRWCWSDSHRIFPWRMTWWLVGICDWKATRGFEVLFKPVGLVKFLGSPKSVWWLLRLSRTLACLQHGPFVILVRSNRFTPVASKNSPIAIITKEKTSPVKLRRNGFGLKCPVDDVLSVFFFQRKLVFFAYLDDHHA